LDLGVASYFYDMFLEITNDIHLGLKFRCYNAETGGWISVIKSPCYRTFYYETDFKIIMVMPGAFFKVALKNPDIK
jgi:hypothetical protein